MLHDAVGDVAGRDPESLHSAYRSALAEAVDAIGRDRAVAASDLDADDVAALAAGESAAATVADAAAILSATPDGPAADSVRREALDDLRLGMIDAVVDAETLAEDVDLDLSPEGVRRRIEGRAPTTLEEYACLRSSLERRRG